ncbi:MAG TPA: hypothetical protein VLT59_07830 [Steroidobacteraceae bacterium]|nr:hypothetical protein [Steroidobacteraceae bacterium]
MTDKNKRRQQDAQVNGTPDQADDWEARVLDRIAARVDAVTTSQSEAGEGDVQYGWEQGNLTRLAQHLRRKRPR